MLEKPLKVRENDKSKFRQKFKKIYTLPSKKNNNKTTKWSDYIHAAPFKMF